MSPQIHRTIPPHVDPVDPQCPPPSHAFPDHSPPSVPPPHHPHKLTHHSLHPHLHQRKPSGYLHRRTTSFRNLPRSRPRFLHKGDARNHARGRQVQAASDFCRGHLEPSETNAGHLPSNGDDRDADGDGEDGKWSSWLSPPRKRRKIGGSGGRDFPESALGDGTLVSDGGGGALPQELVISNVVAARFPLVDLIRARTVCKAWKEAIFSPLFSPDFLSNRHCQRPWLIVEHHSPSGPSIAAYDLYHQDTNWFVIPTPSRFQHLIAVSNGLFCFVKRREAEGRKVPCLVVGNPLTNQWKDLPEIPMSEQAHGPQIVSMAADPSTGSYKVIVLFGIWDSDASDAYLPFMYDSVSCGWTCRSTVAASLVFATSRSALRHPRTLLSIDHHALHLLSYDIGDNTYTTSHLRHLPPFFDCDDPKTNMWRRLPQITVCNRILFLVARCSKNTVPDCQVGHMPIVLHGCLGIWKMDPDGDKWEFVTQVPLDLLDQIIRDSDGTDFIIASNRCSQIFFVLKGSPRMLAFDITSMSWTLHHGCPADYNAYPLHQSAFYESLLWIRGL